MKPPPPRTSTLVYSTDSGRICPGCGQPVAACICKAKAGNVGKGDGTVRVSRETKGRGGKAVTVIRGVPLDADGLAALGKQLRTCLRNGRHAEGRCAGSAGRSRRTRDRVVEAARLAGKTRRRLTSNCVQEPRDESSCFWPSSVQSQCHLRLETGLRRSLSGCVSETYGGVPEWCSQSTRQDRRPPRT